MFSRKRFLAFIDPLTTTLGIVTRRAASATPRALASRTFASKVALPSLPYDYGELEPVISGKIMEIHHSKHHAAYVNNYNAVLEQLQAALAAGDDAKVLQLRSAINFNGGGHVNHTLFWENLANPNSGGGGEPHGTLAAAITRRFASFDDFIKNFNAAAAGVQGSGWAWLVYNTSSREVDITTRQNQDAVALTPNHVPLLGVDVWEHAYYLQYENRRPEYLGEIWKVIDWERVGARYDAAAAE